MNKLLDICHRFKKGNVLKHKLISQDYESLYLNAKVDK